MERKLTDVYKKNAVAYLTGKRRALNEGGTSSSKTISIIQLLIDIASNYKGDKPLLISIVSETVPHLKRGCIRDFINIMGNDFDQNKYNRSDNIYHFDNANIEFFSADNASRLRGARRDILYINECNNVSLEAFRELDIRTNKFTFLDWNPVSEFWAHTELMGKPENEYIHSTYQDARWVLPEAVVKNIESNRNDVNWWNVYGLGLVGKVEGLVYPTFELVDKLPEAYSDRFFGLDFGYTDPTALVECRFGLDGGLYCKELIYQPRMTITDILARFEELDIKKIDDTIYADSASPEQIEELNRNGYDVKGCPKGADSVEFGHQKVRTYKQFWTTDSTCCIKEQRNFRYIPDVNGNLTNKTEHAFSHGMDARRYAVVGRTSNLNPFELINKLANN